MIQRIVASIICSRVTALFLACQPVSPGPPGGFGVCEPWRRACILFIDSFTSDGMRHAREGYHFSAMQGKKVMADCNKQMCLLG